MATPITTGRCAHGTSCAAALTSAPAAKTMAEPMIGSAPSPPVRDRPESAAPATAAERTAATTIDASKLDSWKSGLMKSRATRDDAGV